MYTVFNKQPAWVLETLYARVTVIFTYVATLPCEVCAQIIDKQFDSGDLGWQTKHLIHAIHCPLGQQSTDTTR